MVRVHTSEGATGYGEVSATPRWSGEDAVSATHFIKDVLAPALMGQQRGDQTLGQVESQEKASHLVQDHAEAQPKDAHQEIATIRRSSDDSSQRDRLIHLAAGVRLCTHLTRPESR